MSASAAQYTAFYAEAIQGGEVWTVRDVNGYPAPETTTGSRAMPFWSKRSRAERVVSTAPAYAGFEVVPVPLDAFRDRGCPGWSETAYWSASTGPESARRATTLHQRPSSRRLRQTHKCSSQPCGSAVLADATEPAFAVVPGSVQACPGHRLRDASWSRRSCCC